MVLLIMYVPIYSTNQQLISYNNESQIHKQKRKRTDKSYKVVINHSTSQCRQQGKLQISQLVQQKQEKHSVRHLHIIRQHFMGQDEAYIDREPRERSRQIKYIPQMVKQQLQSCSLMKNKILGLIKSQKSNRFNSQYRNQLNFQWNDNEDTSGSHKLLLGKKDNVKDSLKDEGVDSWKNKPYGKMTERDWRIFREDYQIYIRGGRVPFPFREWKQLPGLNHILISNLLKLKFERPKPIQMQAIPIGLSQRDLIAIAPTGEGKTLAYLISIIQFLLPLERLNWSNCDKGPYAIVLVPSRELAQQIEVQFLKISQNLDIVCYTAVGGKQIQLQSLALNKGCDLLIGTPGRIKQLVEKHYISLERLSWCVIDQADKMISENLSEEVQAILQMSGSQSIVQNDKRRIMNMFSATMIPQIQMLTKKYLSPNYSYITIGEPGGGKKQIDQHIQMVDQNGKMERLWNILKNLPGPIIVFVNSRQKCDKITKKMQEKSKRTVSEYHGGKNQQQRQRIIANFRGGKCEILIATDLAGRGLDVKGISAVINFDAPKNISEFIHRAGRTGRAGMKGKAFTFLTADDERIFYDVRTFLQRNQFYVPEALKHHVAAQVKPGTVANVARRQQILYTN